jgi:iron complex transport system substrate-binding protein
MRPRELSGLVGFWLSLLAGLHAAAAAPPQRIVSFNLCTDQLVVALADPDQIVGLSPYATDPALSVVADKATQFPRLEWQAEATLPLKPDLVLTGAWDRSVTRRLLDRLGIRVVERPLVTDMADIRREIVEVAALVGHPERGRALLGALDAAETRLKARPPLRETALMVERSGFAAGRSSLAPALLAQAGLYPPAGAPPGLGGYVPLERLIELHPDIIVLKDALVTPTDQGTLYLTHPALRALYPPARQLIFPTRYTFCGGPAAVEALNYLAEVTEKLEQQSSGR